VCIGVRAQRFDLNLPVWYRRTGEARWQSGITETVSATGTLIRAADTAPSEWPVSVVIALPSAAGCLIGRGRLVRTSDTDGEPAATFAVSVGHFHIRSKSVLKRIA
jgi:hypothetical protein